MFGLQAAQGIDHGLLACQFGTGNVGLEFAAAREPHHDDGGQDAQHDIGDDAGHIVGNAGAFFVLEHHAIDEVADDAGEEHHEGVHYALDEGEGDHVAVGDVADLVAQDGLHFVTAHALQQASRYGHQGGVLVPAGRKGVGLVAREDAHFRHLDAGLGGQLLNGGDQPALFFRAGVLDDLGTRAALGHPFGDEQREQRTDHAEDKADDEQVAQLQGVAGAVGRTDTQNAEHNARDHDDGQVGQQEQRNA